MLLQKVVISMFYKIFSMILALLINQVNRHCSKQLANVTLLCAKLFLFKIYKNTGSSYCRAWNYWGRDMKIICHFNNQENSKLVFPSRYIVIQQKLGIIMLPIVGITLSQQLHMMMDSLRDSLGSEGLVLCLHLRYTQSQHQGKEYLLKRMILRARG